MKFIYCIIFTLFLQILFSQQKINDGWINVAGKSEKQIKKIIYQEIKKQNTLALSFVEGQKNELEESSEDKKIIFQRKKLSLRKKLDLSSNLKETAEIELIDSKDNYNSIFSDFSAAEMQIANLDSSIIENKKLINNRKKDVEDELSKIPLHDFIVSMIYDTEAKNPTNNDAKMDYLSAKKAIENKLGFDIIQSTLIDNGVISDQRISTMLSGKVNIDLKSTRITDEKDDGTIIFDRIRYGKVKVYPFQVEDNKALRSVKNLNSNNIDTYSLITEEERSNEIISNLSSSVQRKIKRLALEVETDNAESASRIAEIGRKTKIFIKNRQNEIQKSQFQKDALSLTLERYRKELSASIQDTLNLNKIFLETSANYNADNKRFTDHIYSERYFFVEKRSEEGIESKDIDDQLSDIADNLYGIFISRVNTQIVKDRKEISDGLLDEFEGSQKDGANIYAIKVIGKTYIPARDDQPDRIALYLSFDYGFKFKEFESLKKKPKPKTTKRMLAARKRFDERKKSKSTEQQTTSPKRATELASADFDSTKFIGSFSASFKNLTFKSLNNDYFKPKAGFSIGFTTYNFNIGHTSKVAYEFSLNEHDILTNFQIDDNEFTGGQDASYVMHRSHKIEYGKIILASNFDTGDTRTTFTSFIPVLGMGYSFSSFKLYQNTDDDNPYASDTSGPYYFIELFGPYGFGVIYRSTLKSDQPQSWNELSIAFNFMWN